ncbi:hypothetical protein [Xanthobacter autotrophicus]|uniref:hypothetical protein n=1 Tax=Xanthobacter autotrophicus TaxID=280 RepID=UPI00372BECE8
MTFPVPDGAFYPHLRRGELAVVDLADHQPAQGELFLISYGSPNVESGFVYRICQMRGRMEFQRPDGCLVLRPEDGAVQAMCWTAGHWIPPGTREGYAAALRTGCVGTSEGLFHHRARRREAGGARRRRVGAGAAGDSGASAS